MVTAVAAVDIIELKVVETGTIRVPKAAYDKAKEEKRLPYYLDRFLSDIDSDVAVTEPDGTTYNPYWMPDASES